MASNIIRAAFLTLGKMISFITMRDAPAICPRARPPELSVAVLSQTSGLKANRGSLLASKPGLFLASAEARSVWPRAVGALAAGSLIYLSTLYRGLTYAQRINGLPYVLFVFSGLMLVAGFVLTLRTPRLRYTIASLLLAGVFAGNWYVLMMDC